MKLSPEELQFLEALERIQKPQFPTFTVIFCLTGAILTLVIMATILSQF